MTRVLVLRAREDALRTSEKLRAMRLTPVVSPVLEIVATGAPIPAGTYDAVLASSAKGVECAGADIERYKALPFHAVGARTAATAEARGWHGSVVAGNAEAALPQLLARHLQPAHFLYLAGRDRQPTLETGLRARGHVVTAVNVYEARAVSALSDEALKALVAGDVDIVLHYSRRSAEIFLRLAQDAGLTERLSNVAHAALSEDVAMPFRAMGFDPVVARSPDEAGLLAVAETLK